MFPKAFQGILSCNQGLEQFALNDKGTEVSLYFESPAVLIYDQRSHGRGGQQSSNSFLPRLFSATELPSELSVNFQDNGFVLFEKKKSMTLMTIKGHWV